MNNLASVQDRNQTKRFLFDELILICHELRMNNMKTYCMYVLKFSKVIIIIQGLQRQKLQQTGQDRWGPKDATEEFFCVCFTCPLDSILFAVLTVSPNKQYLGIFRPTTPATTVPLWIPKSMERVVNDKGTKSSKMHY